MANKMREFMAEHRILGHRFIRPGHKKINLVTKKLREFKVEH